MSFKSGYQLVLGGKNLNTLWTTGVDLVTLQCQELKPSLSVTQESVSGASGKYQSARDMRLKFDVVPIPFKVNPTTQQQDARTYFQLMKVLSRKYQRIISIDENFKRIEDNTNGLIATNVIGSLPLDVQVLEVSELDSDYADASNTMTFSVVSDERYTF